MPQPTAQASQNSFDIQLWMAIVRRRHLQFLIPLFLGWLAVWGASWVLPPHYKSGTLILVEQPTMPKDYVVPNVGENFQQRLQSITEQILSRSRLLHIREELNLYPNGGSGLTPEAVVEQMRQDIEVELVRGENNSVSAFHIYYSARDAIIAQQVTTKLA